MENLNLPTLSFDLAISNRSIIYLAISIIVASLIVILIARHTQPKAVK